MRSWISRQWKIVCDKGAVHWTIFVLLLTIGWFAGQWLEHASGMTGARYWLYRNEMRFGTRAPRTPHQTAIVLLGDQDYWSESYAGRSPVNRAQIARLLDILREDGVQTIALDLDLRSPQPGCESCDFSLYRQEDLALDQAIKNLCHAGNWLIVSTSVRLTDGQYNQVPSLYSRAKEHGPAQDYNCLIPGYIQLPHDLRQFPGSLTLADGSQLDSFAMAAVKTLDPVRYQKAARNPDRGFLFSQYLSEADYGPDTGPFLFSAGELLRLHQTDPNSVRHQLAQKVVLIGGAWHTTAAGQGPRADLYDSPVGPEPGVFLHANYIEALNDGSGTFAPMPDWLVEAIEFALAIGLAWVGVQPIHPGLKWLAFAATILISFVLTYILLANLGIFMDFLVPLCLLIVHTLVEEVIAGRRELHHLQQRYAKEAHHEAKPV